MRCRRAAVAAAVAGAALLPAGCAGEADPYVLDVTPDEFPAWSTMARLAEQGRVTVGTSVEEGPGPDAEPGAVPVSFDVEIARMVAGALGLDLDGIEWMPVGATDAERLIEDGHVDLVVASLPLAGASDEVIDLAGPYYEAGRALLVPVGTPGIAGPEDLAGRRVCAAVAGPDALLPADAEVATRDTYAECLSELDSGAAVAVLGEAAVLAAHVAGAPDRFALAGEPFAEQAYGIGVPKADDGLRTFVNDVIEQAAADGRWVAAWDSTAGTVLGPAEPPRVGTLP